MAASPGDLVEDLRTLQLEEQPGPDNLPNSLQEFMTRSDFFDDQERAKLRKNAVHQLFKIIRQWAETKSKAKGYIHIIGSYG